MNVKKLLFSLLFGTCTLSFAQGTLRSAQENNVDEYEPPLEYAYKNTFEFFGGWSANASRYPGLMDKGLGCFGKGVTDGSNWQMRFSRFGFKDKHWGWFVQFEVSPMWGELYTLGNRAAEDCGWSHVDFKRENEYGCWEREGGGTTYGQAIMGAVYRYDFAKHWSLRPRVGIGYRSMTSYCGDVTISRPLSDDRAEVYYYAFDLCDKRGNSKDSRTRCIAFNTSIQLQFTPHRHMFFSAELGFSGTFGRLYQRTNAEHYILGRDPEFGYLNWAEEIECSTQMRVNNVSHMGQFIDFSIGIGWNVGRNQNDRNRGD